MPWWWPWGKSGEDEEMAERSKFSALLTGVMSAVQKASTTAGQQNFYMLDHYFDRDESGQYVPKTVRIMTAPGYYMDVPLITLIEPGGYKLDGLEMELSVRLSLDSIKKATHDSVGHSVNKGSYQVELCPKGHGDSRRSSDVVDVKITFKGDDPSEGLMKIIEDLNNTISTKRAPAKQVVDEVDQTADTEVSGDFFVIDEGDDGNTDA